VDVASSLNGLIIVASAISVIAQYSDTIHRTEVASMKDQMRDVDLKNTNGDAGLVSIKPDWDEFMKGECLRANRFVEALFVFLIACIVFHAVVVFFPDYSGKWALLCFAIYLGWTSLWLGLRLRCMAKEREDKRSSTKQIRATYEAVMSSIKSHDRHHHEQEPS